MPFTHPDNIVITEGRYRKDFSSVEARAADIKKVGQFNPILVRCENNQLILVDGECRTRACKLLNRDVWYTTHEDGKLQLDSELQHRLIELMSNVSRQDMTPVERAQAIADIDRLMKETLGQKERGPGVNKEGHATIDTAKMLGYKDRSTVVHAHLIAKASKLMPELSEAKTMSEAVKMVQIKLRLEAHQELAERRAAEPQTGPIADPKEYFSKRVILGDCLEGMKSLKAGIATIFLTDIPYGIDYKTEDLRENKAAKKNLSKKTLGLYHDLPEDILPLVESVIQQMSRVGRPNCFIYMFCAFRYWSHLSQVFQQYGFNTYNKPMIWVRGSIAANHIHPGNCNNPAKWPASVTDCILFASKGDTALVKQGQPDVIICNPVSYSTKIHSLQRPIPLLTELISRIYLPGTKGLLIDPFAGSGSSLAAAMYFDGLSYFGYESDQDNRERAIAYLINEYTKMHSPEESGLDLDGLEI